jgi:hypothetical protein
MQASLLGRWGCCKRSNIQQCPNRASQTKNLLVGGALALWNSLAPRMLVCLRKKALYVEDVVHWLLQVLMTGSRFLVVRRRSPSFLAHWISLLFSWSVGLDADKNYLHPKYKSVFASLYIF